VSELGVQETEGDPGGIRAILTNIWQELITEFHPAAAAADIGPEVDFFLTGGTSVVAVMMLGRIYEETGVDISFQAFMEEPTIRGLSRRIIDAVLAEPVPTHGAQ
jgi:aryl carrier-like protein